MRIFFLSSWFPYPPNNGSKIRVYNLVRALSHKHDVTLVTFYNVGETTDTAQIDSICRVAAVVAQPVFHPGSVRALLAFLSPRPRHVVDTYSSEMARLVRGELKTHSYDIIVASEAGTTAYVPKKRTIAAIYEDPELARIRDQYIRARSAPARFRNWLTWQKTRRYVLWLLQRFDACSVVSGQEKAILRDIAPLYEDVQIIPNGVDVVSLRPGMALPRPGALIYNGALTYNANYDAMRYFLTDIWPLLKQQEPAASLTITGKIEGVDLKRLPLGDGATLTGYLPDIRSTVAGAWACIVPLRIGAGTRLKILEAMALGTPVVSTSKGAEGLNVTPEKDILIADDPAQFAAQTVRLLHDGELRGRLAANGRHLVEREYSWQFIGAQFVQFVESQVKKSTQL